MKENKAKLLMIGTIFTGAMIAVAFSTTDKQITPPERVYTITIPYQLGNAAFQMFNGNGDNVTVAEFKAVGQLVNAQFQKEAAQFRFEDSVSNSQVKKVDTTHKKP